jgi:hypothetical protein
LRRLLMASSSITAGGDGRGEGDGGDGSGGGGGGEGGSGEGGRGTGGGGEGGEDATFWRKDQDWAAMSRQGSMLSFCRAAYRALARGKVASRDLF